MRIFFIGCVHFSRAMLETLLSIEEAEVVGVATKSKSKFNADHTDLSDLAIENDIPFQYVKDINAPEVLEWIKGLNADVVYCFGWSSLIKKDLLELTRIGVIGYHPAQLPMNRGRHPIIWALVLGLEITASTFFKMDEGADSGDILSQEEVKIKTSDSAKELYENLTEVAKIQVITFTKELASEQAVFITQDHSKANYWRKRGRLDGEIHFSSSSETIYNLVRALSKPYVGAHLMYGGEEVKIWKCEIGPEIPKNHEPGKVINTTEDHKILVKTGNGSIWIVDHEFESLPDQNSYIV